MYSILPVDSCHGTTIVTSDCTIVTSGHNSITRTTFIQTIVLPKKLATGSIHDYLFCYCHLVGILFEISEKLFQNLWCMPLKQTNIDSNHNMRNPTAIQVGNGYKKSHVGLSWCSDMVLSTLIHIEIYM